jgi:hypothetical protein
MAASPAMAGRCSTVSSAGAREMGLYVIIDLHAAPGGQTGINHDDGSGYPLMFYLPRERELTVKFWQAIAQHYRGNPAILGYDLLNEPIAPTHDAMLNSKLEPFYREVTAAIRQADPGGSSSWPARAGARPSRCSGRPSPAISSTPTIRSGRTPSAIPSSATSISRRATTCRCSSAKPAS